MSVHDVLLIVVLFEVTIFEVARLFTDVDVAPIFVVALLLYDADSVLPIVDVLLFLDDDYVFFGNFDVVFVLDDVDGLFEPDAVALNTVFDVQGDVEVVLCNLL